MIVTCNQVCTSYLDKPILKDLSFTINEKDKIGIVGINGIGKSTLLKTILGDIELDSGIIYKKKDLKVAYLPQNPEFNENATILEEATRLTKDQSEYGVTSSLNKMGLFEHDKLVKHLSGGEKKRLGIAVILVTQCDLLLLDEPTNHLDIWMINFLEKFLIKFSKALVLVTHDRYFLERVTNKILEIERPNSFGGNGILYDANYSRFLELKAERLQNLKASERRLSAILKKESEWIKMNPQARSTKSKERIERFYKLEEESKEVTNIISDQSSKIEISSSKTRLSKKTIILDNISKSINGKVLFQNLSYNVNRFDRLGIVGPNGCGKTTLFNCILGLKQPDSGTITIGETCNIGYFKQEDEVLHTNIKIIDYLKQYGENIKTKDGILSASQLLENYMFSPDIQQMPVSILSGGERRRLQLLTVLIKNPNILFLDEPTNDLDIYTIELFENYLENFVGAVIVVSHDRYFLDKIVDHLLVFENNNVKESLISITDYIQESVNSKKENNKQNKTTNNKDENIPRFTSKEKKEFQTIESEIETIEKRLSEIEKESLACGSDYQRLMELQKEKEELEQQLLEKLERWEYLTDLNEKIQNQKRGNKYE